MKKPTDVFDRDREWAALDEFVHSPKPGATLGLVYGRRRQGKTYLLEAITEANHGLYFAALEQSTHQNLQRLAATYQSFIGSDVRVRFDTWEEAFEALLALGANSTSPVPVVIDELPYLLNRAPELESSIQAVMSPRGRAVTSWRTRLILCGSALSTMQGLLGGTSPLRGRASLELMVHPFDYREAAAFWGLEHDPALAVRVHALVGGTAAYQDMSGGRGPTSHAELDEWVVHALLNPASAMFREANALLSGEERIADTAPYFAVLAAISEGRTRRGEIASTVGTSEAALTHPLTVLTDARLVAPLSDALKQKRTTYHIAEPVLRLYQLVIAPHEARLVRHRGADVWREVADTVASSIYGPHFEDLSRAWCAQHASFDTLGGHASVVAPTEVACREHGRSHQIDIVVGATSPQVGSRVVAIGEAKWRSAPCDLSHIRRLEHLRSLLRLPGAVTLLMMSRSGFSQGLIEAAGQRPDIELVDLERLYRGS